MLRQPGGRKKFGVLLLVLSAMLLAELLQGSGAFGPVDQRLQDFWFQWRSLRAEPQHVVIVVIDEETLATYPDDPMIFWTDRLAKAIARLRQVGVRAVGLDMLLSISPERWLSKLGGELRDAARDYDRLFREEINSGRLILAASRIGSGARDSDYLLPSPDYLLALPSFDITGYLGLADLFDEGDGVIRNYLVAPVAAIHRVPLAGSVPELALPALVAIRATGLDPRADQWQMGGIGFSREQSATPIPYFGPPNSFTMIPLWRLLADGALEDPAILGLKNKVVLIGATAAGFNDDHFTPYATRLFGGRGALMAGVEIHANVVESLLSGSRLLPLNVELRRVSLLMLTGFAAFAAFAFVALSAWWGGALWLVMLVGLVGGGYLAFCAGILMPIAVYAAATALIFLGVIGWRLTGEERERARIRQMFGRYVSNQVVESLLESGLRPELGGQSQAMTVLFSDIRNFTTISEQLNPREVVEMLNTYFELACAPLLAEGGSIDKFIGDAIMVEFGSPLPLADHAMRGLRAAVRLRAVADDFATWLVERFPDRKLPAFAIGIGLHCGEAVIGNIGSLARMEFTAIGDTVNLASRLEGMTKELGCVILASEAVISEAGRSVVCGRSEVIRVKGRTAEVLVFEVLDVNELNTGG